MCVGLKLQKRPRIIFHLKKCAVTIEAMAAANFSRDVIEYDLIYFETVIEKPQQEEKKAPIIIDLNHEFEKFMEKKRCISSSAWAKKLYNQCDWLKIGKKERCGKRCKQSYCSTHSKYINKGCVKFSASLFMLWCGSEETQSVMWPLRTKI